MNPSLAYGIAIVSFFIFAAFFIYIPVKTLLTRRPAIYPARNMFFAMCVISIPLIAYKLMSFLPSDQPLNVIDWAIPLFFSVILISFWVQMRGYMVTGASDTYFREALLASTKALGLSTDESLSRIKIKETGDEIEILLQGWTGTAQMKPLNKDSKPTVTKITHEMTTYFQNNSGKMNYVAAWLGVFAGLIMFAVISSMLFLEWV